MALNEKQEKFAQNYILHRNATEAAKAAGYAKESAYNQGYRLANGHTNSAIKALELLSRVRGNKNEKNIDMSPEGLETNIIENLQILGKKKVMELVDRCDFNLQIELDKELHQQHQEKIQQEPQE